MFAGYDAFLVFAYDDEAFRIGGVQELPGPVFEGGALYVQAGPAIERLPQ